tara:strand:- start:2722 stop:3582 length:861 start_codon:yes stop_codon:yes gene_type:complete
MPTNVYFNHSVKTEQHLYEDLVVESLRFYGHDVLYLPRTIVEQDGILNDDVQSTFGDAYSVEMYLENVEGFEGEGDLVSKFGVQIQEEATFIISLRTWERFISLDSNLATSLRPNEGDLIYFPLTGSLFEINFVEDQDPFFQLGKMFVFKMRCSLFSYGGEDFDTGTAADLVEADSAYTIELTMNTGSGNFIHGENLTTVIDSTTVTVGEVVLWQPTSRKLTIKDNTRTLQVGDTLTGATSTTARTIGAITDVMTFGTDHSAQNVEFESQDSNYLDFSEVNPFGEP